MKELERLRAEHKRCERDGMDTRAAEMYHNSFGALLDFAEAVYKAANRSPTMCAGPVVNPAFQRLRAALAGEERDDG